VKTPALLLIAVALLAACSQDEPAQQAAAPPAQAAPPAPGQPQQAPQPQEAAAETADVAVAEVEEPRDGLDPCDLRGYDMSKMTVEQHEQLVKLCAKSKE
jgi:hypothetical protein